MSAVLHTSACTTHLFKLHCGKGEKKRAKKTYTNQNSTTSHPAFLPFLPCQGLGLLCPCGAVCTVIIINCNYNFEAHPLNHYIYHSVQSEIFHLILLYSKTASNISTPINRPPPLHQVQIPTLGIHVPVPVQSSTSNVCSGHSIPTPSTSTVGTNYSHARIHPSCSLWVKQSSTGIKKKRLLYTVFMADRLGCQGCSMQEFLPIRSWTLATTTSV
ncbi:hypothetical protein M431DRAFT_471724 [Trichoderma harzianum CBS 226.95]|uniref:Uncharacterized protein n=1 Tax=Trichoderma harzianum CBS 226.95 TaxID=983964 RepID=A0A2T4A6R4_TRIHA|nr:hypothetical protein M431DRAFT_471724 [Trichoderma harzianum CBS 226.95]PTB52772.1 hypothetical protein M431DRAFT_471724 [Trichoderma harzianum CBS 226.95]